MRVEVRNEIFIFELNDVTYSNINSNVVVGFKTATITNEHFNIHMSGSNALHFGPLDGVTQIQAVNIEASLADVPSILLLMNSTRQGLNVKMTSQQTTFKVRLLDNLSLLLEMKDFKSEGTSHEQSIKFDITGGHLKIKQETSNELLTSDHFALHVIAKYVEGKICSSSIAFKLKHANIDLGDDILQAIHILKALLDNLQRSQSFSLRSQAMVVTYSQNNHQFVTRLEKSSVHLETNKLDFRSPQMEIAVDNVIVLEASKLLKDSSDSAIVVTANATADGLVMSCSLKGLCLRMRERDIQTIIGLNLFSTQLSLQDSVVLFIPETLSTRVLFLVDRAESSTNKEGITRISTAFDVLIHEEFKGDVLKEAEKKLKSRMQLETAFMRLGFVNVASVAKASIDISSRSPLRLVIMDMKMKISVCYDSLRTLIELILYFEVLNEAIEGIEGLIDEEPNEKIIIETEEDLITDDEVDDFVQDEGVKQSIRFDNNPMMMSAFVVHPKMAMTQVIKTGYFDLVYKGDDYEKLSELPGDLKSSENGKVEVRGADITIHLHEGSDWGSNRSKNKYVIVTVEDCFIQLAKLNHEMKNRLMVSAKDITVQDGGRKLDDGQNLETILQYVEKEDEPRDDDDRMFTIVLESIHITRQGNLDAKFHIELLPIGLSIHEETQAYLQKFLISDFQMYSSRFIMERLWLSGVRYLKPSYYSYVGYGYENIRMELASKYTEREKKSLMRIFNEMVAEAVQNVSAKNEWMNYFTSLFKKNGGEALKKHINTGYSGMKTAYDNASKLFKYRSHELSINDALLGLDRSLSALQMLDEIETPSIYPDIGNRHLSPRKTRNVRVTSDMEFLVSEDEDEHLKILLPQFIHATSYKQSSTPSFTTILMEKIAGKQDLMLLAHWLLQCESAYKCIWLHRSTLTTMSTEMPVLKAEIDKQDKLVEKLTVICKDIQRMGKLAPKSEKERILKDFLTGTDLFRNETITYPLDPTVMIDHIDIDDAAVFNSATSPACLSFISTDNKRYRTIFKVGDDLRQDMIILQVIKLMDRVLKKAGKEFCLTPYDVLPCGTKAGFVQCVSPSTTVESISNKHGQSIPEWLAGQITNGKTTLSPAEQKQNYINSCAAYCVISYVLGIGDRHLENIMLTPDGKLFHIDFGYVLGAEPPSKYVVAYDMKLSKEMVIGLGGRTANLLFKQRIIECYVELRKHAQLFIDMLSLVSDAGIEYITRDRVEIVRTRFKLDAKDEEEASDHIIQIVEDCAGRLLSEFGDALHVYMQGLKQ